MDGLLETNNLACSQSLFTSSGVLSVDGDFVEEEATERRLFAELEDYEFVERLGQGSYGTVVSAKCRNSFAA